MKQAGLSKVLWLVSSVLLIFAGVLAVISPLDALFTMTVVFGLVMLVSGLGGVIIYLVARNYLYGVGWILADSMVTVVLSILLFCGSIKNEALIPFVFGMWILFSGVVRFIDSLELRRFGVKGWYYLTLVGVACAGLGFSFLVSPDFAAKVIGILTGVVFIVQGAASLFMWWFANRLSIAVKEDKDEGSTE